MIDVQYSAYLPNKSVTKTFLILRHVENTTHFFKHIYVRLRLPFLYFQLLQLSNILYRSFFFCHLGGRFLLQKFILNAQKSMLKE